MAIPAVLFYCVTRQRRMPFRHMGVWFGLFIFLCGGGHLLDFLGGFWPSYHFLAYWKLATGLVSLTTAILLAPIIPKALMMRSNEELEGEVRRAREQLRSSTEQLKIVTDSMSACVARVSADMKYLWVSNRYAQWLGLATNEIIGKTVLEVLGDEVYGLLNSQFNVVLTGKPWNFEGEVPYRGIGKRWVTAIYTPTFAAGVCNGFVAVINDITDIKQAEKELQEADRKKDEFLAMLAHELRNPLAPLVNMLEVLKRESENRPRIQQVHEMMERQTKLLSHLVNDLLDVSRITRGKIQIKKTTVNLRDIVSRAVESVQGLCNSKGHQITVDFAQSAFVEGDESRLHQVFSNLLNNACKYTDRGGDITVYGERKGNNVEVTVADTGIGIKPELLSQIFGLFAQAERGLDRSEGGLGIGLTLAKNLVEMHGGRVTAHSQGLGKGSQFVVSLPCVEAEDRETSKNPAELPTEGMLRILVVDDNRDAADSLALTMLGQFEVRCSYMPLDAIKQADEWKPDVVLLDIGLPEIDGYEVCRRLRMRHPPTLAIVALTGYGSAQDKDKSKRAGFDAHLVKPADPAEIQSMVYKAYRGRLTSGGLGLNLY